EVATLTVDASRAGRFDWTGSYDLVTLAAEKQPEKEFAALLRSANETMGSVTVADGSPLVGVPVGALRPTVAAVRAADGPVETLPGRGRVCAAGDTLYVIGRPGELRKLDAVADPDTAAAVATARAEPDEGRSGGRLRGMFEAIAGR
ncbi:MAG: TrkA C-terminal domain-containing protein, partial [Halobacteriaceae archaeon]